MALRSKLDAINPSVDVIYQLYAGQGKDTRYVRDLIHLDENTSLYDDALGLTLRG